MFCWRSDCQRKRAERGAHAPTTPSTAKSPLLVEVLFRVVKSQAADREIDDFMTVPRSRPG